MINDIKYVTSGMKKEHFPTDGKNEYLFLGRSNVGKSSLINFLSGRKNIARVSKVPGKTTMLNFFLVNEEVYFVDSPGYGYAKRSKKQIDDFGKMIENYLVNRVNLKKVYLLVDYKVGPTKDDLIMYDFLKHFDINLIIVATKIDKLNQKERSAANKRFKEHFKTERIILTSTVKNIGLEELQKTFIEENTEWEK